MGRHGPRPLPENVHDLHGRPGKRPRRQEAPTPPSDGHLKAPAWLSKDAKAAWRELIPAIERAWPDFLGVVDVPALSLMVENYAMAIAAAKALRERGRGLKNPKVIDTDEAHRDRLRKHPAAQVLKEATATYLSLAKEYGLTAVGRIGLDLSSLPGFADDEDEDDDLFDAGR